MKSVWLKISFQDLEVGREKWFGWVQIKLKETHKEERSLATEPALKPWDIRGQQWKTGEMQQHAKLS